MYDEYLYNKLVFNYTDKINMLENDSEYIYSINSTDELFLVTISVTNIKTKIQERFTI